MDARCAELLSSELTIRDGRAHPAVAVRRQMKCEQPGGSACLRTARKQHSAAGIGLRTFWGLPANAGCAVWRIDSHNTAVLCLSALLRRGRGRQVGDGRNKSHFALQ